MTVDFREYFWGEANNGFDILYHNMKYGYIATKDLGEFFRERSLIEETNSKLLAKLAKHANNCCTQGTFAPLWQILRASSEKLSSLHAQMVQRFQDLIKEINKYCDEQHKKHKQVKDSEAGTLEVVQSIQQTTTSLHKAKELYNARYIEFEKLRRENSSQKELEKAETKCKKACEDYKMYVEKYSCIREDFENKMTLACQHFQDLEVSHLKQMKEFLSNYAQVIENGHKLIGQVHVEFRQQCNEMDIDKLLEQFIQTRGTGVARPGSISFEEADLSSLGQIPSPDLVDIQNEEKSNKKEDNRVVCYFINWAWYRGEEGKFTPSNIDPDLCTHINYAFAVLDENTLRLKSSDTWADVDNTFYAQVTGLKRRNPNLKVLISLGGWTDSAGNKYSRLINNNQKRQEFITNAISFLKTYGFDGLDVDWEYPRCPQGNCASDETDKRQFAVWMRELRAAFDQQSPRLLLTAAVAASKYIIDQAYDVSSLAQSFDFINVMTYDMHNAYEGKTGHHAQFKKRSQDADPNLNVVSTMQYWNSKGVPKDKLVMGIPAYGRSFRLASAGNHGLDAPATGPGDAGEVTKEAGFLGYYEICKRLKNQGWSKGRDPEAGAFTYSGNQWVGYDEPIDAQKKAEWVRDNGFGGVMVWDITMDDFMGRCCNIKNPFLNAMNYGLTGKGKGNYNCP